MRRAAPSVPVTPAMLRHFAAITIVATVCLAMFAHGENTSAKAEGPKGEQAAQGESGGALSAMFGGAEEAALKKAREENGKRTVNGIQIGSKTRLEQGPPPEPEPESYRPEWDSGNISNLNSGGQGQFAVSGGVAGPGITGQSLPPGVPAPIVRDPKGIPIPPSIVRKSQPPNAARAAPAPRRLSEAEVEGIMEASRIRSSTSTRKDLSDDAGDNPGQ